LIINVDNLGASRPRLESIWLLLHVAGEPQVTFLPIYPALPDGNEDGSTTRESLEQLFSLDDGHKPDSVFLAALQKKNLWWNAYLLFDRVALAGFAEWISSAGEDETLDGPLAVSAVPPAREGPRQALLGQFRLAQELCRFTRTPATNDLSVLLALFPGHANTDLDLEAAAGELASLFSSGNGMSCEFPTLPALLQVQ
jgi:hypothetical protein